MKRLIQNHALIAYFVLAYAITYTVQFGYILLQPGQAMERWSAVWFFSVFGPTFSALIISAITGGWAGVKALLSGFARWKVSPFWYFWAAFLFLGPLLVAGVYALLGNPVTGLRPGVTIPALFGTILFTLFSGPVAEEAGWRGFALPGLQEKHGALVSSLILGVIWTFWHIPLFFMTGETQVGIPFPIYMLLVCTLAVYMTWLYNNTHSLIITVLAHFAFNLTGTLITGPLSLMPAMTFYLTSGPLLFLIAVGVVLIYGPKTMRGRAERKVAGKAGQVAV